AERETERAARLRLALDAARMGAWEVDLDSRTISMDEATRALVGLDARVVSLREFGRQLHPADQARVRETLNALEEPGSRGEFESLYRVTPAPGVTRWVRARGRVVREDGRPPCLLGVLVDVTAAQEAAVALQERETHLRLALEAAKMGTWTWHAASGRLRVGQNARELLGASAEEIPLDELLARLPEGEARRLRADLDLALASPPGAGLEGAYTLRHPRLGERRLRVRGRRLEEGTPGLIGVVSDETERLQAEDRRRVAEERFSRLAGANMMGVVVAAADGTFGYANDYFLTLVEATREELEAGRVNWVALTPPEDRPLDERAVRELQERGVTAPYRKRYLLPSGRVVPILTAPARLGNGDLVSVIIDLSEMEEAQRAVRESEARYRALAVASGQVVWTVGPDGAARFPMPDWDALTGQAPGESEGFGWLQAVHPEDRAETLAAWEQAQAGGRSYRVEHRVWNAARGEYRIMRARGVPVFAEGGRLREWIGVHDDVTEAVLAERERERLLAAERQAREAAEEALGLLNGLLDHSPLGIAFLDRDLRYLRVNRSMAELNGLPVAEHLGRPAGEVLPNLPPEAFEPLRRVLETGAPLTNLIVEGETPARPGETRQWREAVYPVRRPDGEVIGLGAIAQDVTDALRAEADRERLLDSEAKAREEAERALGLLSGLLDFSPLGLAFLDLDLRFQRVNRALAEINGIGIADHLGRSLEEVVPNLSEQAEAISRRVLETGQAVTDVIVTGTTPARPGETREWREAYYPVRGPERQVIGLGAIVEDVTEARAREAQLREQAERLAEQARLISLANEVAIVRDADSRILEWNDAAQALYGFTRQEALGRVSHDLLRTVFPASREAVDAVLWERGYWEGQLRHTARDGRALHVLSRQGLERDLQGQGRRILEVNWDITDRVQAEAEVRDLNATLAARVDERTRELRERNAEQEAWIYTASHDLRTPLVSIQGMSAILDEATAGRDWEEAGFAARRIAANAARMSDLLDGLLEISRIGRIGDPPSSLDLGDIVTASLKVLPDRERLAWTLPDAWPRVYYPRNEAGQVVRQVASNAAKFAAGRAAFSWSREGDWVNLHLDDDGPGIPDGQRERVFDLFRQLHPNTPGTGAGLPIVKRIVERHGGRVAVTESPLGGARLTLQFPAAPAAPTRP
ncbi:MAG TPA: PAS domain S-box protein, partial [Deinococcales bacterium]|nr:PAS domain S-box protein [Deinococcales bacterium]